MIKSNFLRNQHLIRARYKIEEIDFFDTNWHSRRISQEELKQIDIVLAADVVYNAEITRSFFQVLKYLLIDVEHDHEHGLEVFISLEKRHYNFFLVLTLSSYVYLLSQKLSRRSLR